MMVDPKPYETIPTMPDCREAVWRDVDGDRLRVVLVPDGSVCLTTLWTWVQLSSDQANELVEFLASRQTGRYT